MKKKISLVFVFFFPFIGARLGFSSLFRNFSKKIKLLVYSFFLNKNKLKLYKNSQKKNKLI